MWGEEEKRFEEREEEDDGIKEGEEVAVERSSTKRVENDREETKEGGEGRKCSLVPDF